MAPVIPHWAQPSHPALIKVVLRPKAFTSGAVSLVTLPAGSLFSRIESATLASKAYSSVQISREEHIELNSDLIYCNHSCEPSLEFDMTKFEVRVARGRDLKVGDALTFFYPSSEWDMAQPFRCECGAGEGKCRVWIAGAGQMGRKALDGYWLNEHIEALLVEKETGVAGNGNKQGANNGEGHTLNGKSGKCGEGNGVGHRVGQVWDGDRWTLNRTSHSGPTSRELGGEMSGDTVYTVNKKSGASSRELGGEMGGDTESGKAPPGKKLGGSAGGDGAVAPSPTPGATSLLDG
ncbi:hypothetical protein GP486_002858 [Trichoglossum hirsutum]|uniref:SET domain-containing protein n=1 Tax=Trichoglossum hirsutum TaxID=265104 RepID=A0A9P8RRC1_9PEZI|nr:hypothetical protein GP486_002858 [Trichoglossum hirsutum]